MSHALLLRLFLSPYFSISVAMHYLKTYPDNIGISHYLCWRMKSMPAEEVEFYWPQICHLLITRPTESNALENFVIQRAEESTHSAMLTFWFMQAALRDLAPTRTTNPRPFLICQRVLHKCHEIIFGDAPEPSRSPYRSLPHSPPSSNSALHSNSTAAALLDGVSSSRLQPMLAPPDPSLPKKRVNPHVSAMLVGIGAMAAGAPGMPGLTKLVGEWAVTQGRRPIDDEQETRARVEVDKAGGADAPKDAKWRKEDPGGGAPKGSESEEGSEEDEKVGSAGEGYVELGHTSKQSLSMITRSTSAHHKNSSRLGQPSTAPPSASSFKIHPAHTTPNLHSTPQICLDDENDPLPRAGSSSGTPSKSKSKRGEDPFSQAPGSQGTLIHSSPGKQHPFYSVPDLNNRRLSIRYGGDEGTPSPEALLASYSLAAQRRLLRSHYCRSEIRFLLLLEDISNRLLVIPKPARVSALRAELTSLNHNLPAEVCMPLWCAADHSHEEGGETNAGNALSSRADRPTDKKKRAHSRVVRISPGDSVVLNSAEKAPYLIHVEILEGDLDFDPTRRENRELLKKIVVQEDMKRRKREGQPATIVDPQLAFAQLKNSGRIFPEGLGLPVPEMITPAPGPATALSSLPTSRTVSLSTEARKQMDPEEVEEIDLVEQLYGNKLSVKDNLPDLTDSIAIPSAPKNKQLDMAVWDRALDTPMSRRSSMQALSPGLQPMTPTLATSPNGHSVDSPIPRVPSPITPNIGTSSGGGIGDENSPPPLLPPTSSSATGPTSGGSGSQSTPQRVLTLEDYSERMRTAAVMLAQLNASLVPPTPEAHSSSASGALRWIPGTGWIMGGSGSNNGGGGPGSPNLDSGSTNGVMSSAGPTQGAATGGKLRLAAAQATAIKERIMEEMMALEDERVARMTHRPDGVELEGGKVGKTAEDEGIVRRELNKSDPSAAIFKESWTAKKSRIRAASPWGHLANWDVISVIVKTGGDLRQEQLATQLIERFGQIFKEEKTECWVRFFRILITGEQSGLVETITDAVSVHSIKKGEYARRLAEGVPIGHVSLMDHYVNTYGKPDSGIFARARRNFIKSLAGYSVVTYLLQIKDRHNGNILIDRDGHLIHIDFGFMLSNSPGGNMGFEAAPFKLPLDYIEIMGGFDSPGFAYYKKLFKEGFEAARKHSDSLIAIVELMQKDSRLDCFLLFGENTIKYFKERFALGLPTSAVDAYLERLIVSSAGSNYTRLYDTFQYYSQGVL